MSVSSLVFFFFYSVFLKIILRLCHGHFQIQFLCTNWKKQKTCHLWIQTLLPLKNIKQHSVCILFFVGFFCFVLFYFFYQITEDIISVGYFETSKSYSTSLNNTMGFYWYHLMNICLFLFLVGIFTFTFDGKKIYIIFQYLYGLLSLNLCRGANSDTSISEVNIKGSYNFSFFYFSKNTTWLIKTVLFYDDPVLFFFEVPILHLFDFSSYFCWWNTCCTLINTNTLES